MTDGTVEVGALAAVLVPLGVSVGAGAVLVPLRVSVVGTAAVLVPLGVSVGAGGTSVTGQTVVVTATTEVMTVLEPAGQLVTVGPHLLMVLVMVEKMVLVVMTGGVLVAGLVVLKVGRAELIGAVVDVRGKTPVEEAGEVVELLGTTTMELETVDLDEEETMTTELEEEETTTTELEEEEETTTTELVVGFSTCLVVVE